MTAAGVREAAGAALGCSDLDDKLARTEALAVAWRAGELTVEPTIDVLDAADVGRPARPVLVDPRNLPRRRLGSPAGRVAAVHAVAHIEANAVNLALDAVHRFDDLPERWYGDWLGVAAEEALHFRLLAEQLDRLGASYGDLPAHDGLWTMAARTAHDPLVRMALVPRVLEARGLDVTPGMARRLRDVGEVDVAVVLDRILADEVGHVAIGDRWFRWLCTRRGLDPVITFRSLCDTEDVLVAPPFNVEARRAAGFDDDELAALNDSWNLRSPRPG